jgi:hypothetical protein
MSRLISDCKFGGVTSVYYPANELFKVGKEEEATNEAAPDEDNEASSLED